MSQVYKEAAELCMYLCELYGLAEKSVVCHSEGYKLGIASNHADVVHWFPKHGKSMDTFREEVRQGLMVESVPSIGFSVGDRILLNGAVYADSYGGGKGRIFRDRICTITRLVDQKRKCPYLLDNGLGWVPKDSIRRV